MVNYTNLPIFFDPDYLYKKECKKTKVISCSSTYYPAKLICLFINKQSILTLEIYNNILGVESQSILDKTTGDVEDMFFKIINFDMQSFIIAYYTNNNDENLRIDVKQLEYNDTNQIFLNKYGTYNTLFIEAKNFNNTMILVVVAMTLSYQQFVIK